MERGSYSPTLVLAFKIAQYFDQDINELFSYTNTGLCIAIFGGIIIASLVVYFLLIHQIGKVDERTAMIRLKIDRIAFASGLVAMTIYVTSIP